MSIVRNRPTPELCALIKHIGGRWHGDTALCHCPAHDDRTPSLSIRQGDRGILVTCHAGCDSRVVMRALARVAQIPTFKHEVIHPSQSRSGMVHHHIWQAGQAIEETLAERYVRDVRNVWAPLQDVRYHPRCPRGQGRLALFEPALLIAMRKAGEVAAIQRIFLDPVYGNYKEKRVLGQAIGAAWTNGAPGKTIGICEGFETAAAYTSLTGIQAWATMGAKRFHQVELPSHVETLILLADNDLEGRRARDRAAETYRRPGLTIETEWPPGRMNDWAQLLKR